MVLGGAVLAIGLVAGGVLRLAFRRDSPVAVDPRSGTRTANPAADDGSLITPEEQVMALLRKEGSRMKQARIAERLDWSAAKTSRVVSDLREAEEVETFRVGRENVVALPKK